MAAAVPAVAQARAAKAAASKAAPKTSGPGPAAPTPASYSDRSYLPLNPASIPVHAFAGAPPAPPRSPRSGSLLPLQRKLAIGSTTDPLETEADQVADQVMKMSASSPQLRGPAATPVLRRKCACEASGAECSECKKKKEEKLMLKAQSSVVPSEAPPSVHQVLRSPGQALDSAARAFFEPRFGADFSRVRIHTDASAAASARSVNALAYTVGNNVVFGAGQYDVGSGDKRRLLAHELAHTLQQSPEGSGKSAPMLQRQTGDPLEEIKSAGTGGVVTSILIDPASGRTRFYLGGTTFYNGTVKLLASSFQPGDYLLERDYSGNPRGTWKIFHGDGSKYFGGLQFDVLLDGVDFDSLSYSGKFPLKVAGGLLPKLVDLDARMKSIQDALAKKAKDAVIVGMFEDIPAEQAEEFVKRLRAEKFGDKPLLEKLDDYVDGEDNMKLHQLLSRLKLQAGGVKSAAKLADAPTLAWHDVMGFFEQKAVFSVTPSGNGKYKIKYLGGISSGLFSSPDYDEVKSMGSKERLNIMTGDGIEVDADQPIMVHDYDSGRTVALTAEDLISYQHAGVRKFLQDVGTIAAIATPAGAESVGAKVLQYGVQIATIATTLVDENKLNIKKWFPTWGPKIIETSERIKVVIAIVGIAQFVHGSWSLVTKLRQLRAARAALDAKAVVTSAEEALQAEKQAQQLETNAQKLLDQADLARKEMGLAEETAQAGKAADQGAAETSKATTATASPAEHAAEAPKTTTATTTTTPSVSPTDKAKVIDAAIGKTDFGGDFSGMANRELANAAQNPARVRPSSMPGYSVEVQIEGTEHFLARKTGGGWCLFSGSPKGCGVIAVATAVDEVFAEMGRTAGPTPLFEALYNGIKRGSDTITKLGKDPEIVKAMGDLSKLSGPAKDELKTALKEVSKIAAVGAKKEMDEATILKFVERLGAQRTGGEGVFESVMEEMKAWRKPTAAQVAAEGTLASAHETVASLKQEKAELEGELTAGPKTPDGKPDTERIKEIRKDLAELTDKKEIDRAGQEYVDREGLINKAERGVTEAEKAAERASVDPKEIMRQAFDASEEKAAVRGAATSDQVGKLLKPPKDLTVEHIVAIKQISEMPGFEKLTVVERNYLAKLKDNLIVMDWSANSSKGPRTWSGWNQAKDFYEADTIAKMTAREADLRKQIQSWIAEKVKSR